MMILRHTVSDEKFPVMSLEHANSIVVQEDDQKSIDFYTLDNRKCGISNLYGRGIMVWVPPDQKLYLCNPTRIMDDEQCVNYLTGSWWQTEPLPIGTGVFAVWPRAKPGPIKVEFAGIVGFTPIVHWLYRPIWIQENGDITMDESGTHIARGMQKCFELDDETRKKYYYV